MSFSYSPLLGLRLLPAMPPPCSSRWLSCLPAFLSLCSWLLPPLSLLHLFPLPGSSPLVLRAFSCLVVFLALFFLGRFMFSSVYWPSVVLVHLLRNSVESQFLRDGVLPLGRVISFDFFVYGQARWHAPGSCCCSLFTREGLRICLLFLFPCSVCIGVSTLPRSFGFLLHRFRGVCSYSLWFGLCGSFCAVLLLFLHVLILSLCLLIVLLVPCPRMLCPISFVVLFFSPCLWFQLLLLFLLLLLRLWRLLPLLVLRSGLTLSGLWLRLRLLLITFLSHLCLRQLPGVLPLFLRHFLYELFDLNLLRGFFFGSVCCCGCCGVILISSFCPISLCGFLCMYGPVV